MKKSKTESIDLSKLQQSIPRIATPVNENEGVAKLYTKKGRLILTPALLDHFEVERQPKKPLYYEMFFDPSKSRIVLKFVGKETGRSYIASDAKNSRFIELRGPCKRQGLLIEEKAKPIAVAIYRDPSAGVIYFAYDGFARATDADPQSKKK